MIRVHLLIQFLLLLQQGFRIILNLSYHLVGQVIATIFKQKNPQHEAEE